MVVNRPSVAPADHKRATIGAPSKFQSTAIRTLRDSTFAKGLNLSPWKEPPESPLGKGCSSYFIEPPLRRGLGWEPLMVANRPSVAPADHKRATIAGTQH